MYKLVWDFWRYRKSTYFRFDVLHLDQSLSVEVRKYARQATLFSLATFTILVMLMSAKAAEVSCPSPENKF